MFLLEKMKKKNYSPDSDNPSYLGFWVGIMFFPDEFAQYRSNF